MIEFARLDDWYSPDGALVDHSGELGIALKRMDGLATRSQVFGAADDMGAAAPGKDGANRSSVRPAIRNSQRNARLE